MTTATPLQPRRVQPFANWNPTRGVWETSQLDLFARSAPLCGAGDYADRIARGLGSRREQRLRSA